MEVINMNGYLVQMVTNARVAEIEVKISKQAARSLLP